MKIKFVLLSLLLAWAMVIILPVNSLQARTLAVKITRTIGEFQVKHGHKIVTVKRDQNTRAQISPAFAKTSRKCPPFCAQPMQAAPGVVTVGEVELIDFMMNELQDGRGLLIDARTADWHARGTIPGSINIPYIEISPSQGADEFSIEDALKRLGAVHKGDNWDFTKAKKLVLWCNGPWCGQSPTAIKGLLELNYPKEKIFYYRGGMQAWQGFGLTVLPPPN